MPDEDLRMKELPPRKDGLYYQRKMTMLQDMMLTLCIFVCLVVPLMMAPLVVTWDNLVAAGFVEQELILGIVSWTSWAVMRKTERRTQQ